MSQVISLKARAYELLDKNPILSARLMAQLLQIPYETHARYLWKIKSKWRHDHQNEHGSIPSIHAWRGWTSLPKEVRTHLRSNDLHGWKLTGARNRWLLWKDADGRLQWFETGRINIYCRTPASKAKVIRLFVRAFSFTGIVEDLALVDAAVKGIKLKGAHYVYATNQRLPSLTIDLFGPSNGIVLKIGDRSHPNGVEILAHYPDWAERNERLLSDFLEMLKGGAVPKLGDDQRMWYVG